MVSELLAVKSFEISLKKNQVLLSNYIWCRGTILFHSGKKQIWGEKKNDILDQKNAESL